MIFKHERLIRQRMVDQDPPNSDARNRLANCETNLAAALIATGQFVEARSCCDGAIAIREDLVRNSPKTADFAQGLAETLMRSGSMSAAIGDFAAAANDWRRAAALYAAHPPDGEAAIFRACCHGSLAGLAGKGKIRITPADAAKQAEEAMAILCRQIAAGYNDIELIRVEPGLDPLRSRDDYRRLIADLSFPTEPFAWQVDEDFRPAAGRQ